MLEAIALRCERGDRTLFDALSFVARPGTLLRVSGANGAGKTSLLRIICGLLEPAAGEMRWQGTPIRAQQNEYGKALAYVGHLNGVKDDLTAHENLRFSAALSSRAAGASEIDAALQAVGLAGFERLLARQLSQGQRRRIALARLHMNAASPLWVLDEPIAALDVEGISALSTLLGQHLARGGIIALTTHHHFLVESPTTQLVDLDAVKAITA